MDTKPNVIFILTDDQGYGDICYNGNPILQTPNIDKLFSESSLFTNYHVGPTCAPTRAGLMTGHYHNSTGVWHTIGGRSLLRKDETTLSDIFRQNGYATGIFGKWHLGDAYPFRPHDRGFDEAIVHGGGGIGQTPDYWGNDYFDDTYYNKGVPQKFKGYCTDVFFALAKDFIRRNKENPFFCYIPTNAPHVPLNVPVEYKEIYKEKVDEDRARYYGMITNIDDNVGDLRDTIRNLGIEDNTILIFMTDNGTASGCETDDEGHIVGGYNSGMRGKKGSPYEGGHRVPFSLYYPDAGLNKAREINTLTANIDLLPTLIDLCGFKKPEDDTFDGHSLEKLLRNNNDEVFDKRVIVTDSQRVPFPIKWKDSCVMFKSWRLINGKELYDLEYDFEQKHDISTMNKDVVRKLRCEYEVWWERVSKRFSEEIPVILGRAVGETTVLTSHDWRGDVDDCAWNQGDIRRGKICNGYFEAEFAVDGIYRIELRRWPAEEDRNMIEGIKDDFIDWYHGGRAIPIREAKLIIGKDEHTKTVNKYDRSIEFILNIQAQQTHVQTFLNDENEEILGAYYLYITLIE